MKSILQSLSIAFARYNRTTPTDEAPFLSRLMKLRFNGQACHLGYCTNIHAAEDWPQLASVLKTNLPQVKEQCSPDQAMGVGLRLSAKAAQQLSQPTAFAELQSILGTEHYVFTINGFPYGEFHGQPVKAEVYRPDWRTDERLVYTKQLADILIRLLPENGYGSISTLPGTFKPWVVNQEQIATQDIVSQLTQMVSHLHELYRRTGKTICLALEPEPFCLLERTTEVIHLFQDAIYTPDTLELLAEHCDCSTEEARQIIQRHLGICFDVCHAAVMFEDPVESIRQLQQANIRIAKIQLSAALKVIDMDDAQRQALSAFNEDVYLHQTVVKTGEKEQAYVDLDDAFQQQDKQGAQEWRSHFHVPVFLPAMQDFDTTQAELIQLLARQRQQMISTHLEVETYTWDVLPEQYRDQDMASAIARELNWVKQQLC